MILSSIGHAFIIYYHAFIIYYHAFIIYYHAFIILLTDYTLIKEIRMNNWYNQSL